VKLLYFFCFLCSCSEDPNDFFSVSESDADTDTDTDTDIDTETDTSDTECHTDTDMDTDTETDTSDTECPGECQYNTISYETLRETRMDVYITESEPATDYLFCDDSYDRNITNWNTFDTEGNYTGWIRDRLYSCPSGQYCCRPQRDTDAFCSGTCISTIKTEKNTKEYCLYASQICR
jgi:hypothetical protein